MTPLGGGAEWKPWLKYHPKVNSEYINILGGKAAAGELTWSALDGDTSDPFALTRVLRDDGEIISQLALPVLTAIATSVTLTLALPAGTDLIFVRNEVKIG